MKKIKVGKVAKKVAKPFVDVPAWIGYNQLKEVTQGICETIKNLFTIKTSEKKETFEEALKRYNLTEEALQQRKNVFTLLTILWTFISMTVLAYGVYLAGSGSWFGFFACFGVTAITLMQAFYYHFWLFQIKSRRLGCTFQEWFSALFSRW